MSPSDKPSGFTNWPKLAEFCSLHHDTYPFIDPTKADLSSKSVFITGASKGIGKATAISFAKAGCRRIAIAARTPLDSTVQAIKAAAPGAEPQILALNVDVTSAESVKAAADEVAKAFDGVVDVVVSNAGYLETFTPVAEADPVDWWRSWEVNVNGTFLTAKYFLPLLLKSEAKVFVGLSSIGAHLLKSGASAYQTNKFAVIRFIEFLDHEYKDDGLISVAIHPGGVPTDLAYGMPENMHQLLVDTPELPADGLVWFAKERKEWLAGRFINSCWDFEEMEKKQKEIVDKDLLKFRMTI
jgi:NAD(P)-dependent dehydrogenase (short-subunit alcohol dehydrogenase family)